MAIQTNKDVTEITYNGVIVPLYHKTQTKSTTITSNGTTTISKDADYDGMTSVEITTNVPTPAPSLQTKSITITSNGSQSVSADSGYDGLEQVNITTNVPAPAPSLQDIAITENGTYTHAGYDGYDEVVVNVSGGGGGDPVDENKQVLFIDYDGTHLHSYTYDEAMALTSLPSNPSHSGLTAQGWNWTLAQIQTYLTSYPYAELVIGQNYVTTDGNTKIYIEMPVNNHACTLRVCVNGTVSVNWGDGSSASSVTGTSLTVVKTVAHTYSSAGEYIINISGSGTYSFYNAIISNDNIFVNSVTKIELGSNFVGLKASSFYYLNNLRAVSIPVFSSAGNSIDQNAFSVCRNLKAVVLPSSVTTMSKLPVGTCTSLEYVSTPSGCAIDNTVAISYSSMLKRINVPVGKTTFANNFLISSAIRAVIIPSGTTAIPQGMLGSCPRLMCVDIPSSVTSIGAQAFYRAYSMRYIKFHPTTPPTVANANAFDSLPAYCTIYVPSGSLSAYTSAANYPSSSTYTYVEY